MTSVRTLIISVSRDDEDWAELNNCSAPTSGREDLVDRELGCRIRLESFVGYGLTAAYGEAVGIGEQTLLGSFDCGQSLAKARRHGGTLLFGDQRLSGITHITLVVSARSLRRRVGTRVVEQIMHSASSSSWALS